MLTSRILSLFRSILRAKQSLIINLTGLSVGFAIIITIAYFVQEERAYNQFHEHIDDLHCLFTIEASATNGYGWHETVPALPEALRTEYPEVKDAALVHNGTENLLVQYGDQKNYENIQLADPNLFHMFSFPVVSGSFPRKITDSHIVALSETSARKYFGKSDPIGKSMKINNTELFTVVAVYEDMPKNSSIHFDMWAPIDLLKEIENPDYLKTWYNLSFKGYVQLQPNTSYTEVNKKLINKIQQSNPESKDKANLFPFSKLYLEAWGHNGNIRTMMLIGLIVMILVCLNFINLQSAEVFKRIKKFGIMKINGASHGHITMHLLSETLIQTMVALGFGIIISYLGKPYLLNLIDKPDTVGSLLSGYTITVVTICVIIIAVLAGVVPALTIRSVTASNSLKEKISERTSIKNLRYVFMAAQFSLAIIFVACLMITARQVQYMRNKNLGFNKEQMLYIHLDGELYEKRQVLQEMLDKKPGVVNSTFTSHSPIGIYWNGSGWDWEGREAEFDPQVTYIETDSRFRETFGINMAHGTYYETDEPGIVINETLANMIAPDGDAMGKLLTLESQGIQINVIGIINDIHFKPLNREIGALMLLPEMGFERMNYLFVKVSPASMPQTLDEIENTVKTLNPDYPYWHHFLDDDFARMYGNEETLRTQMAFFSMLAILISCMGLWGIMVFVVKQRVKEIGIRKVNGARISEILTLLNKDFAKWVALAFVIATPIAWYAMAKWLENFAYKTEISWWIFAVAGALALGIALLTVSFQSWKAATRNPVEALRYE